MRFATKFFLSAVFTLTMAAFLATTASARDMKIGYVNLQKALNLSEAGVKAKDTLKSEATAREKELDPKQAEVKALKDEIEQKKSVWNEQTRKAKEKEFAEKSKELEKQVMKLLESLNKKQKTTEAQIIDDLSAIVKDVAKKGGYTYVFESSVSGLLVAPPEDDITDAVIEAYNKKYKEENK
jgi:outer membrane protein